MRIDEDIVNFFWEDEKNKMVWFEFIEKIDEGRNLFIVWLIDTKFILRVMMNFVTL